MTKNTIVWVVQEGNNDYSSAEDYGTVQFVTKGDYRSMAGEQNSLVHHDIKKFKSLYIPGEDYLILAGNPMVTALTIMSLTPGRHKFLKWDGKRSVYIPFELDSYNVK